MTWVFEHYIYFKVWSRPCYLKCWQLGIRSRSSAIREENEDFYLKSERNQKQIKFLNFESIHFPTRILEKNLLEILRAEKFPQNCRTSRVFWGTSSTKTLRKSWKWKFLFLKFDSNCLKSFWIIFCR